MGSGETGQQELLSQEGSGQETMDLAWLESSP